MAKKSLVNSFDFTEAKPPKHALSPVVVALSILIVPVVVSLFGSYVIPSEYGICAQFVAFALVLAMVLFWNARVNGRTKEALGFHVGGWHSFFPGISLGVVLTLLAMGLILLCNGFGFEISGTYRVWFVLLLVGGFLVQSLAEELLFRGYVQNGVLAATKKPWTAIVVQALLFTLLHSLRPQIDPLAILSFFAFGVLFGLLFEYSDSVWFGTGAHFIWYVVPTILFGMHVSGYDAPSSILISLPQGPDLLSGGSFGLEGSMLTLLIVVSLCAIYVLFIQRIEKSAAKKKRA